MRKGLFSTLLVIFLIGIFDFYFYPLLPEKFASHWNLFGEADGYLSKNTALLFIPAVSFLIFFLQILLPILDPLKENIQKFRKYFDLFCTFLVGFFFYLNALMVFWNLGYKFDFIRFLIPAFAFLFFYMGILIEHSKRNWFIGIRTPWTLSSDRVWQRTHSRGARLFKLSALISLFGVVFPKYGLIFVLAPVIATSVYALIFSYLEFQRENKK